MRTAILLLLISAGIAVESAKAQTALTPQQRQAILDYQLTPPKATALLDSMEALTKYVASLPNAQGRRLRLATMTPAELEALMQRDPKAMAILTQNKLTPREYLVGTGALTMAYTIAVTGASNEYVFGSAANVAFAKAHQAELKTRMDAVRAAARGK